MLEGLLKDLNTKALAYKTKPVTWDPYVLDNPPRLPKLSQDYLWAASTPMAPYNEHFTDMRTEAWSVLARW